MVALRSQGTGGGRGLSGPHWVWLPMQEIQETWVLPMGWEDPLEKEMATHSNVLTWRIPQTEEPDRL